MANVRRPRHGSLQFWPRVRAKRIYPRIRKWLQSIHVGSLGFAGYKAGMTHIQFIDDAPNSLTKGETVSMPVTLVECPPLKVFGLRFYSSSPYGLSVSHSIFAQKLDKILERKMNLPKKYDFEKRLKNIEGSLDGYSDVRLLVYTQPRLINLKKTPEIFELGIGGSVSEKFNYAKELLGKDLNVKDVFDNGVMVDVHAVTKGKGFQGPIKRYGLGLRSHKGEKKRRSAGSLGAWTPKRVPWTAPLPGQMGYHTRTELNKEIVFISDKVEHVNPKSGFNRYGFIKGDYLLLKGSIPGNRKRLIILTNAKRSKKTFVKSMKFIKK